jgi:hypothetical protein
MGVMRAFVCGPSSLYAVSETDMQQTSVNKDRLIAERGNVHEVKEDCWDCF